MGSPPSLTPDLARVLFLNGMDTVDIAKHTGCEEHEAERALQNYRRGNVYYGIYPTLTPRMSMWGYSSPRDGEGK